MCARIGCIVVSVRNFSACSLWRGSSERVRTFETGCGEGNVPALRMTLRMLLLFADSCEGFLCLGAVS